jgi:pimeloyl-ACP methyl ester carboxylesterase
MGAAYVKGRVFEHIPKQSYDQSLPTHFVKRTDGIAVDVPVYSALPRSRADIEAGGSGRAAAASAWDAVPAVFVVSHGNAADLGTIYRQMDRCADSTGCAFVSYDYTGYGLNVGTPGERECVEDLRQVYAWLVRERRVPSSKIVLVGKSLGAGPAIEIAAGYSEDLEMRPAGLVTMCGFKSCVSVVSDGAASLFPCMDMFDNVDAMSRVRVPTFVVHGTSDRIVPLEHAPALYAGLRRSVKRKLCMFKGKGHDNLMKAMLETKLFQRFLVFSGVVPADFANSSSSSSGDDRQREASRGSGGGSGGSVRRAPSDARKKRASDEDDRRSSSNSSSSSSVQEMAPLSFNCDRRGDGKYGCDSPLDSGQAKGNDDGGGDDDDDDARGKDESIGASASICRDGSSSDCGRLDGVVFDEIRSASSGERRTSDPIEVVDPTISQPLHSPARGSAGFRRPLDAQQLSAAPAETPLLLLDSTCRRDAPVSPTKSSDQVAVRRTAAAAAVSSASAVGISRDQDAPAEPVKLATPAGREPLYKIPQPSPSSSSSSSSGPHQPNAHVIRDDHVDRDLQAGTDQSSRVKLE